MNEDVFIPGCGLEPNLAPAPNRQSRFAFAASPGFVSSYCAPAAFPAAVGEAQREAYSYDHDSYDTWRDVVL